MLEVSLIISYKVKINTYLYNLTISLLGCIFTQSLSINVQRNLIHNGQRLTRTQIFITSEWIKIL